jgi:hypothetical protein
MKSTPLKKPATRARERAKYQGAGAAGQRVAVSAGQQVAHQDGVLKGRAAR